MWVVSTALLINEVDYPVANAYVTDTAPAAGLLAVPPEDPGQAQRHLNFRNLAYAGQWWVFAAFAVVIWLRVLRDERRRPEEATGDEPTDEPADEPGDEPADEPRAQAVTTPVTSVAGPSRTIGPTNAPGEDET